MNSGPPTGSSSSSPEARPLHWLRTPVLPRSPIRERRSSKKRAPPGSGWSRFRGRTPRSPPFRHRASEGPFLFAGFLPAKPGPRRKALERLSMLPYTLVFYEAPHRVVECVEDMSAALGPERVLVIARELTKLFEQIHRCVLGEAAAWLREDRERGEFVLIAEGAAAPSESAKLDWERVLTTLIAELPLAHAVKLTCKLTGA